MCWKTDVEPESRRKSRWWEGKQEVKTGTINHSKGEDADGGSGRLHGSRIRTSRALCSGPQGASRRLDGNGALSFCFSSRLNRKELNVLVEQGVWSSSAHQLRKQITRFLLTFRTNQD